MTADEQDAIERFRRRLESLTEEEVAEYWAERKEAERLADLKRVGREHRLHQLGVAMMWLGTLVLAFGVGYTQNRTLSQSTAVIAVFGIVALLMIGLGLVTINPPDPERLLRRRSDRRPPGG